MTDSIIDISRRFFEDVVRPILEEHFPAETAQTAFGVFGYGSEALGMDDEYSRDHHWGVRIDALMPAQIFETKRMQILETLQAHVPNSYEGHSLREAYVASAGLAPDNLQAFLRRTIGLDRAPQTWQEWLNIPEEDIIHVVNGELWLDQRGEFSAVRQTFLGLLSRTGAAAADRSLVSLLLWDGRLCTQAGDAAPQRILRDHSL